MRVKISGCVGQGVIHDDRFVLVKKMRKPKTDANEPQKEGHTQNWYKPEVNALEGVCWHLIVQILTP